MFKFLLVELHETSKLSKYMDEICNLLDRGTVYYSYCVDLIRCCDNDPLLANVLARIVKVPSSNSSCDQSSGSKEDRGWWTVSSALSITATNFLLQIKHPNVLEIDLPDSFPAPPSLKELLAQLGRGHYSGVLILDLWHSYVHFDPSDEFLAPLDLTE